MKREGIESVTNCHQLKLTAADGKTYLTDVANAETLLRLVRCVPRAPPMEKEEWTVAGSTNLRSNASGCFLGI
jgi:hypothetical protein